MPLDKLHYLNLLSNQFYKISPILIVGQYFAQDISPPSGITVKELQGAMVTFNCSIFRNSTGIQQITEWRIANIGDSSATGIVFALEAEEYEYGGVPLDMPIGTIVNHRNTLILKQYNLHNKMLQCALSQDVFAEYFLFTYSEFDNYSIISHVVLISLLCFLRSTTTYKRD